MLANNTIVIPNSTLSNSTAFNHYYPEKASSMQVTFGGHDDTDLEQAAQVTLEVARET